MKESDLPLVYSCSGCSNLAQLANQLALDLDQTKIAEMSCIAGLGGNIKPLIRKAKSGQKILALDGCPLHCVKQTLKRHELEPKWHFTFTELGLKKRPHELFTSFEFQQVKNTVLEKIHHDLNN